MSKKSGKKNARKCGKCGRTGHYAKTCKYKTKVAKKVKRFTEIDIEAMIERAVKKALKAGLSPAKIYTQQRHQQTCPRCKGTGKIYCFDWHKQRPQYNENDEK